MIERVMQTKFWCENLKEKHQFKCLAVGIMVILNGFRRNGMKGCGLDSSGSR
jgi:hypothetical protein